MSQVRRPSNLPNTNKNAVERAREQAKAYDSLFDGATLDLGNNETIDIPPHPEWGMLDEDQMEAYDSLLFEVESYDREPDVIIPEETLENGKIVPEQIIRGEILKPHRKTVDGITELIRPSFRTRIVMVALGDAEYKRLTDGGYNAGDVWRIWNRRSLEIGLLQDPKSS